jgi:uncharacterized metal-binding protein
MPSGKFHDAVTILLAPAAGGVCYAATQNITASVILTAGFLFGGLMFGPDLDTVSKQYSRWSVLRILWFPYRSFFKHRSRWSHGLVFGSFLRVVYFVGTVTVAAFLAVTLWSMLSGGTAPGFGGLTGTWQRFGELFREYIGQIYLLAAFIGIWLGAASHTFTDMAGSYVKTGRIMEFL